MLHAEKAASFQFPNEWLRIVGGGQALPLGKITPPLHSAAKSCSAEAGLRPAKRAASLQSASSRSADRLSRQHCLQPKLSADQLRCVCYQVVALKYSQVQ